jgi:lysophospholipase L1-like esterase
MRFSIRNSLKVVGWNLLIIFLLGSALYWSIPVVDLISVRLGHEHAGLVEYRSFIGWRHLPLQHEIIQVAGEPYAQRRTINDTGAGPRKAYFFGGSTMWGFGVRDAETIPSLFAGTTRMHSENYGEIGYTSHQSLLLLLQLLQSGHRPALVVFYDGANDVAIKCERGRRPDAHGRERDINALLQGYDRPASFASYFRPVVRLADRIGKGFANAAGMPRYDCDSDPAKAQAIARNLGEDWRFAKLLTEQAGGKFIGILQPVVYSTRTGTHDLKLPPGLDRQFATVYPLIREQIRDRDELHDFSAMLDGEAPLFVDFNHVVPEGNRLVAKKVADVVATMGFAD